MKKHVIAAAVLTTLLSGAAMAQAQTEGPWMVRVRAVHLQSDNGGSTTPNLNLSINNKWLPEVDISYFYTKNIAVELILTVPQKQTLYSAGTEIGSFRHLPPTLTAQYHFDSGSGIKPYVGAGFNYTRISSVDIKVAGADVKRSSTGLALQAGVDIPISKGMYFNVDVKKVYIKTDVTLAGAKLGDFKVDPVLVGAGVGWRF